jgi:hypothetical protein
LEAQEFWSPNEEVVSSYKELVDVVEDVFTKWQRDKNKVFAWRGQVDSRWPLYSSLYRRAAWTRGTQLEERDLAREEAKVLTSAHRWGLHVSESGGRLSVLAQLAALQHFGAPTRMIDVTFNPWIGAWFAVEEKWDNAVPKHEDADARLFAVDVTGRLINENDDYRNWEDCMRRPWPTERDPAGMNEAEAEARKALRKLWSTKVFAWRAPRYNARIAAQIGGFLLGGVPASRGPEGPNQWPKEGGGYWAIDEVRAATCLSLRPHKLRVTRGGVSQDAVYTIRITASAKQDIRNRLQKGFGYTHSSMYPDFTGFANFGAPELRTREGV